MSRPLSDRRTVYSASAHRPPSSRGGYVILPIVDLRKATTNCNPLEVILRIVKSNLQEAKSNPIGFVLLLHLILRMIPLLYPPTVITEQPQL